MNQERPTTLALRDTYLRSARAPYADTLRQVNLDFIQLVQHAATNSAYWRSKLPTELVTGNDAMARNISLFPIQSRIEVQQNFDEAKIYIPGSSDSDYFMATTSGTTGQPVRVLKYRPTYAAEYDAITLLEWRWFRRDISKTLVRLRPSGRELKQTTWGKLANFIGTPGLVYEIPVSGKNNQMIIEKILEYRPTYLYGFPSSLINLIKSMQESGQEITGIEQVQTAAENLAPWQRELIGETFGAKVVDRYSSEEFGYLAMQCPKYDHLHVISPSVYLEIINEQGQPCQIGEVGQVLVTGLHSFAMPLIRYAIGDMAAWGEPSDCGINWPILDYIEGRVHDYRILPDGTRRRISFNVTDFVKFPQLLEYQGVLLNDRTVMIVAVSRDLSDEQIEKIKSEVAAKVNLDLAVEVLITKKIPLLSRLKRNPLEVIDLPWSADLAAEELLGMIEKQGNAKPQE